jgi:hypothetical protein
MKKTGQPTLFKLNRIVGVRFTEGEYERLSAAAEKEKAKLPVWQRNGHKMSVSEFVRNRMKDVLESPSQAAAVKPATVVKSGKKKKNRGSAKARHRRSGRSVPKTARKSRR